MARTVIYPGAGGRQIVQAGDSTAEATRQAVRSETGAAAAAASAAATVGIAGTLTGLSGFIRACGREMLSKGGMRFRIGRRVYATLTAAEGFRFYKLILPKTVTIDDDLTTPLTARLTKFVRAEVVTGMVFRVGHRLLGRWDVRNGLQPVRMVIPAGARVSDDLTRTITDRLLSPVTLDATKIWYWGDSRTEGAGAGTPNRFPEFMAGLFPAVTHSNRGRSSQTAIQIACRQGGVPLALSVTGNSLPASGAVAVTAINADVFRYAGVDYAAGSISGTLAGIAGTLTSAGTGSGGLTFTRSGSGSVTAIDAFAPFVPSEGTTSRNAINYICIGTNGAGTDLLTGRAGDYTYDTVRYALAMVQSIVAKGGVALVASVISSNPSTISDFSQFDAVNRQLRAVMGAYYVDFETPPTAEELGGANALAGTSYAFTTADNTDIAAGHWPRGLFADSAHFTSTGQAIQAIRVKRNLKQRGIL